MEEAPVNLDGGLEAKERKHGHWRWQHLGDTSDHAPADLLAVLQIPRMWTKKASDVEPAWLDAGSREQRKMLKRNLFCLCACLFVCLFVYMFGCVFVCLRVWLCVCLFVFFVFCFAFVCLLCLFCLVVCFCWLVCLFVCVVLV